MRRFIKLIFVCVTACALVTLFTLLKVKLCFNGAQSYSFFTGDTSKDCKEVKAQGNALLVRLLLYRVCGESAEYDSLDLQKFLNEVKGEIVFCEELEDSVNYYCRADLPYSVTLYGEKINLHISVKENAVKVGSPIIFGGF